MVISSSLYVTTLMQVVPPTPQQKFHDDLQICNDSLQMFNDELCSWSLPLSYSIGRGGEQKMEGTVVRRVRAECPRCVGGRTE